jgi:hypothetical protein
MKLHSTGYQACWANLEIVVTGKILVAYKSTNDSVPYK